MYEANLSLYHLRPMARAIKAKRVAILIVDIDMNVNMNKINGISINCLMMDLGLLFSNYFP